RRICFGAGRKLGFARIEESEVEYVARELDGSDDDRDDARRQEQRFDAGHDRRPRRSGFTAVRLERLTTRLPAPGVLARGFSRAPGCSDEVRFSIRCGYIWANTAERCFRSGDTLARRCGKTRSARAGLQRQVGVWIRGCRCITRRP